MFTIDRPITDHLKPADGGGDEARSTQVLRALQPGLGEGARRAHRKRTEKRGAGTFLTRVRVPKAGLAGGVQPPAMLDGERTGLP